LRIQREAFDMVVDEARGDRAFTHHQAERVERHLARRLAGQRALRLPPDQRQALRRVGRRPRIVAERLAVREIVARAAPGVEQPGALACPAVEQPAGEAERLGSRIDDRFRPRDQLQPPRKVAPCRISLR
jgi:hypothetical protein